MGQEMAPRHNILKLLFYKRIITLLFFVVQKDHLSKHIAIKFKKTKLKKKFFTILLSRYEESMYLLLVPKVSKY